MSIQHYKDKVAEMPLAELQARQSKLKDKHAQLVDIGRRLQATGDTAGLEINLIAKASVVAKLRAIDVAIRHSNETETE